MKKHFIVKRDDTFGNIGLIEKGAPDTFYSLEGMGVAHDCLEHFKGDSGSIDDEFQAIGCMLHLRYDTSTLRDMDILVEMIALYRFFLDDHPCKPAKKIINPDHVCIQCVANELEKFLQNEGFEDFSNFDIFVNSFIYWTSFGYKKAIKKYKNSYKTLTTFKEIERQVNRFLKYAEEWQEVIIQYFPNNIDRCVTLHEIDTYDYDY